MLSCNVHVGVTYCQMVLFPPNIVDNVSDFNSFLQTLSMYWYE